MGGDDELRFLVNQPGAGHHIVEGRQQGELAHRGERGFGLVEQVEPTGDEATLEQAQESFAVGGLVQPFAVALADAGQLALVRHTGIIDGLGAVGVFAVDRAQLFFKVLADARHAPGVTEEILGAQEKTAVAASVPGQAQAVGQGAHVGEGLVLAALFGADHGQSCGASQRFDQG